MQANEALEVLSLRSGATPAEIKAAYRDLVKVWHPDRFGTDAELRRKAENKLKQLNEAYRVLRSPAGVNGTYDSGQVRATSTHRSASAQRPPQSVPVARRDKVSHRAAYACVCLALLACIFAASFAIHRRTTRLEQSSEHVESHVDAPLAGQPQMPEQEGANVLPMRGSSSSARTLSDSTPTENRHSDPARAAQFQVRALSDAETEQLESACARQKERQDPAAYRKCVEAQLKVITKASELPDLSTLSESERESIESVCSEAKLGRGPMRLHHCVTMQVASLAAEPARPDWSAVTEDDRDAIESACRSAKYREGPAAYDRCLARTINLLKQSR